MNTYVRLSVNDNENAIGKVPKILKCIQSNEDFFAFKTHPNNQQQKILNDKIIVTA